MNRGIKVLQTHALPLGYVAMDEKSVIRRFFLNGAAYEARTRYLHLGKVARYQLSYASKGIAVTRDVVYNTTYQSKCQLFFSFFKNYFFVLRLRMISSKSSAVKVKTLSQKLHVVFTIPVSSGKERSSSTGIVVNALTTRSFEQGQ